jgi:branched-chain amino acid transport system substrate-binding protein
MNRRGAATLGMRCIAAIALLGAACASTAGDSRFREDQPVRIGWIDDGTDSGAAMELLALRLAVEELNAAGGILGRVVELLEFDTGGDEDAYADGAIELVTAGACAVVGPSTDQAAYRVGPALEKANVPMVLTSATDPGLTAVTFGAYTRPRPYCYRAGVSDVYLGFASACWAAERFGPERIAIVADRDDPAAMRAAFAIDLTLRALRRECHLFSTKDASKDAAVIADTSFGLVFMCADFKVASPLVRSLRSAGVACPVVGEASWQAAESADAPLEGLGDCWYAAQASRGDPSCAPFASRFEARFGLRPSARAFVARDALALVAAAIELAGVDEGRRVAQALHGIRVDGITATLDISTANHDPYMRTVTIVEIAGGEARFFERYVPDLESLMRDPSNGVVRAFGDSRFAGAARRREHQ